MIYNKDPLAPRKPHLHEGAICLSKQVESFRSHMFAEEGQLYFENSGALFEPVKGFKELPLQEEADVDFFSFQEELEPPSTMSSTCSDPWELGLPDTLQDGQLDDQSNSQPQCQSQPQFNSNDAFVFPELSLCEEQLPEQAPQRGGCFSPVSAFRSFSSAAVAFPVTSVPSVSLETPQPLQSIASTFDSVASGSKTKVDADTTDCNTGGNTDAEADAEVEVEADTDADADNDAARYVKQPRQGRYSGSSSPRGKRVSDSRLSAQGLAEVLQLDSPDEALRRERYILDIFETELHYPLGYKTWVRDTSRDYRIKLIDQLYDRVKERYPEYDRCVLETIIRRATYYMMQSRLRRERRARAKGKRAVEKRAIAS
ncbi:uncharacterized protein ZBAI_02858 [Zygosaccharomyces bailii ISA1307]|nr:uncharacterized protein ZBAI_02858 [Zygosaccharomyces bailii ISA1307]